jgi:hypothetical protein
MGIADLRTGEADIKRAAIVKGLLDSRKGLDQSLDLSKAPSISQIPRMELVQTALKPGTLDLLHRLQDQYAVESFTFGQSLHDIAQDNADAGTPAGDSSWIQRLSAYEPQTKLGDAISDVIARARGQASAGIVVITDGQNNAGKSLISTAEQAKLEGVPIYAWGVGISQPRDIVVADLFTRDVAFVDDEVPVSVRVRSPGLAGENSTINLTLNGQLVDSQQISFDHSGEQVVSMRFTPKEKGKFTLTARIEPRSDEASKENNEASQPIKIIDDKIKVLFIDQTPRWEYKYLMALLMRDRRVDFKTVLLEADPSVSDDPTGPFLKEIPADVEALTKFDLIILGDVDPHVFTDAQITAIDRWVRQGGGGLLSIAGTRFNPWGYADSKIADLLPVDISEHPGLAVSVPPMNAEKPIHVELTPAGQENSMMRLVDDEAASAELWSQLPPIFWDAAIYRAKPAAQVLLTDPDPAKETRFGKLPLIALSQVGLGQVIYVGTHETWRWRKNGGDAYYVALWGQIIQRLSLPHLLGGSKKTQISTDKQKYFVGQKVTIMARLFNDSLVPIDDQSVKAFYSVNGGAPVPLELRLAGSDKGIYKGEFTPATPGDYQVWADRDDKTRRDFSVVQTDVELTETAMNELGLRDLSVGSGGQFFREENLYQLPDVLRNKTQKIQRTEEVELWSSWAYFGLFVIIITIEWILRKMVMLK